jgi:hypothetical protein
MLLCVIVSDGIGVVVFANCFVIIVSVSVVVVIFID